MSLVAAAYGSDEEESSEEDAKQEPSRYLAAAAVLPPEIRAALEGRESDGDSDEDDSYSGGQAAPDLPVRKVDGSKHGLLAMLPSARDVVTVAPVDAVGAAAVEQVDVGRMFRRREVVEKSSSHQQQQEPASAVVPKRSVMTESRKRRELESALMEGDASVLAGEEVVEVTARVEERTAEQLVAANDSSGDVRIEAPFYNPKTGTNITTVRPSKLQRRRHQINSLAQTAAERELQLLERTNAAASSSTKRHSQSRYGW